MDEPVEVRCKTLEEARNLIKASGKGMLEIANDPIRLLHGWSDGKTWWTLNISEAQKVEEWSDLHYRTFQTQEGQEALLLIFRAAKNSQ